MPKKPKSQTLKRILEAALYVLPLLLPFAFWFALQKKFASYHPTAADLSALASGFIVLLVFFVQQYLKSASLSSRFNEFQIKVDRMEQEIKKLTEEKRLAKQASASPAARITNLPPAKPKQEMLFEHGTSTLPVFDKHPIIEEAVAAPPPHAPQLSENEILGILRLKFAEFARSFESNADRITTSLNLELPDSNHRPKITVIYRDGAVENSQTYRLQKEDVQIPNPSIAVIFPSGNARLFPSPMAGQDCFHDVKAFESMTPGPSQKRSGLARCEPANLARNNENTFQLSQLGKLDFRF